MIRKSLQGMVVRYGFLILSISTQSVADDTSSIPAPAQQAGYAVNTYSSNFSRATVDTEVSRSRGFKWYNWDLFGKRSDPLGVQLNPDGSATLADTGQLLSAVHIGNLGDFVGTSFGGGAYIEAELKLETPTPTPGAKAWPAFWSLQMEGNVLPHASQWIGQPSGYVHSIEADFFEYMHKPEEQPSTAYGASLHDWYGIYNKTCGPGLCQVSMPYSVGTKKAPPGADLREYHRYGFLWVPASAQATGYAKFYFDRAQMGPTQEWQLLKDQPPPPTNQSWAFGIIDRQHLFLILSTGAGQPMTVRSVGVWQASAAGNLTH
jgi:hypothetical protein